MQLSSRTLAFVGGVIRVVVLLSYVGLVIRGFCIIRSKQVDPSRLQYITTHDLPAGYRLHAADFRFDPPIPQVKRGQLPAEVDPAGKYLTKAYPQNATIVRSDLVSAPVIEVGKDMLKYWFPLGQQPEFADILNANSRVDVCAGVCAFEDVRVLSIVCSSLRPWECYAALELPAGGNTKITGEVKNYRLILRGR
jgi:hypothetical protein